MLINLLPLLFYFLLSQFLISFTYSFFFFKKKKKIAKDIKKHQSNSTSGLVIVKFNEIVTVRRTWAKKDYDRKGEVTWKLTPDKAIEIRNELNEFKREMEVHLESRGNTHFY